MDGFSTGDALHSCPRCGREFEGAASARICDGCRTATVEKPRPRVSKLTFREQQLADLVTKGKLNKEIAFELHLADGTIKDYLHRIFVKLGVSNRTELAVWNLTHPKGTE